MNRYLKTVIAALGLFAFGLIVSSCADTSTDGGTHEMGPPGKKYSVPDSAHPNMAR